MKPISLLSSFFLLHCLLACHTNNEASRPPASASTKNNRQSISYYKPDYVVLTKNFDTWYAYTYRNIKLAQDFIGLDEKAKAVEKDVFLTALLTGKYIPLKTQLRNNVPVYQLHPMDKLSPDIRATLEEMARNELANYKLEGTTLPDYAFTDLDGKKYTNPTTRGNYLVLKCWFIHCVACVQEFPELNKLVDTYKERNDIMFLSLATDSRQELIPFLKKKSFSYAVIPDAEPYLENKLGMTRYPTHIVVDKDGRIIKVANSVNDLLPFLNRELASPTS